MNRILASLILAPALVLASLAATSAPARAQSLSLEPIDSIVAVVDEDVILRSELDRAVANILAQYADRADQLPPRDVLDRQVLERLILTRLQVQRADISGIRVSDAEVDEAIGRLAQQNGISMEQLRGQLARDGIAYSEFRGSLHDEIVIQRMRQRVVQSRVAVSETEIDIMLASSSLKGGQVQIGHILVALPDGATPEQLAAAQTKIDGIAKLVEDGMDFSAAAIRYSDAPNALDGGVLDWRNFNEVDPTIANQLQGMQPGDVSPPMRSPNGFHLIKLIDRRGEGDSQQTVTEYNARGILARIDELQDSDQARAIIDEARRRIEAGEDFGDVARDLSQDTMSRNQGGDMGWFQPYAYGTAVGDQLVSMQDGQLSEPFRSNAGWHLIERLGSREQDVTEEVRRAEARETIARRKSEEEFERFVRQLRDEAYVDIRLAGV